MKDCEFASDEAAPGTINRKTDPPSLGLPHPDRTVAVASLIAVLSGASAAKMDMALLLQYVGLPPDTFDHPERRIEQALWARAIKRATFTTNDEAIHLLKRPIPIGTFLMIARAFIHCKTIGEAMHRFVNFYDLLQTGLTYRLEVSRRKARFACAVDYPGAVKHMVVADYSLVSFHRLFSWLANELIELDGVTLSGGPPNYAGEYSTAFFNVPIQFEQPEHSLSFGQAFMDLPIVRSEQDLEEYLTRFSSAMFLPLPKSGQVSRRLRVYMADHHERLGELPELPEVAQAMGAHPRQLTRHLREEGVSFRDVKSRVRRDIAISYLVNTQHSIESIAERSGFSEPSAFIRAFRGWTGTTPLLYRKTAASHGKP